MYKVILFLFFAHVYCSNYSTLNQIHQGPFKPLNNTTFNSTKIYSPIKSYRRQYKESFRNDPYVLYNKNKFIKSEVQSEPLIQKEELSKFVPTKMYAQVRASHIIERVPREKVLESEENKENAAHLKEVVTSKKIATVYTEEGFEDSEYDHGGRIRDANFNEDYARKFYNEFDKKKSAIPYKTYVYPHSTDDNNYYDAYKEYPKGLKIIPESINKGRRNLAKRKNKKGKKIEKSLNKKFIESNNFPKFVVLQRIKQLERDLENNSETEKSENYTENSKYAGGNTDNTNDVISQNSEIKPTFRKKTENQLENARKMSKINYAAMDRNRDNENNIVLNRRPSTSKVMDNYEKTIYLKHDSRILPNDEYFQITTLKNSVSEIPVTTNYINIYNKFFKKRQHRNADTYFKELKEKNTVQPDLFISEDVSTHGSHLLLSTEKTNISGSDRSINSFRNKSANIPLLKSITLYDYFQSVLKQSNNKSSSETKSPDINKLSYQSLLNYYNSKTDRDLKNHLGHNNTKFKKLFIIGHLKSSLNANGQKIDSNNQEKMYPFKKNMYASFKTPDFHNTCLYFNTTCASPVMNKNTKLNKNTHREFHLTPNRKELFNILYFYPSTSFKKIVLNKHLIRKKRSERLNNGYHKLNKILVKSPFEVILYNQKYPFYKKSINMNLMTLKYILNPKRVPKKTFGRMEFYDSRNNLTCKEVNPKLKNIVSMKQNSKEKQQLQTTSSRLPGLKPELDCLRNKYFDDNPLDNPLFSELQVGQPILPPDFNITKLISRIMRLLSTKDNSFKR